MDQILVRILDLLATRYMMANDPFQELADYNRPYAMKTLKDSYEAALASVV